MTDFEIATIALDLYKLNMNYKVLGEDGIIYKGISYAKCLQSVMEAHQNDQSNTDAYQKGYQEGHKIGYLNIGASSVVEVDQKSWQKGYDEGFEKGYDKGIVENERDHAIAIEKVKAQIDLKTREDEAVSEIIDLSRVNT